MFSNQHMIFWTTFRFVAKIEEEKILGPVQTKSKYLILQQIKEEEKNNFLNSIMFPSSYP